MQLQYSKPGTRPATFRLDQHYLRDVVARLAFPRVFGTPDNARVEGIVAEEFRQSQASVLIAGKARNVVGGDLDKARFLIGAHYDSAPNTPGADDNASAVAVMLAVARVLGRRAEVAYVAFNGEECGFVGSQEFVTRTAARMKALEQVHILEMVGYRDRRPGSQRNPLPILRAPATADFLGIVANDDALVNHIIDRAGAIQAPVVGLAIPRGMSLATIRQVSPHLLRSDHAAFWEKDIPAAMWTDTSEFRNPHYHQPTDTPDTLDYEFMADVGALLASVVRS